MSKPESISTSRGEGWFKCSRNPDARELARRSPNAFILAWFIADRARFKDTFSAEGLMPGEAMLGDYSQYGFSEREYRTAKHNLQKWDFATFRTTPKGTVGKLTDTRLFDPRNLGGDGQNAKLETDERRTNDEQTTTNKNGKNVKNGKNEDTHSDDASEIPFPEVPSWEAVRARAQFIGLFEWKARDWYDEMEGCGWVDYSQRPIRRWQNVLNRVKAKWEADGRPEGPPSARPTSRNADSKSTKEGLTTKSL